MNVTLVDLTKGQHPLKHAGDWIPSYVQGLTKMKWEQ